MTPEQVERVMVLVRAFGERCWGEGNSYAFSLDDSEYPSQMAEAGLGEIQAALTTESEGDE